MEPAAIRAAVTRSANALHLARIRQPVLVVTGADHHGFAPGQAREAVGMLARGQLAVLPDTAYLAPLEAPAASADLVLGLWSGVEAGVAP